MTIKYLKKAIKTPATDDHKTRAAVQEILNDLEKRREEGIKEISKKFDKYEGEVVVTKEKIEEASKKVDQKTKDDIQFAHERIKRFAEHQLKHLNNNFEIEKGFMTTIHSFTSDQRLLDNSHKDPRRARSAGQSIVPTSTGASKTIGEIIPSLKGKLEGVAMRVPTPNVSLIELVFCTKKEITKEKINTSFIKASKGTYKGILALTEEKLVSIDFNHNPNSAIVDLSLTSVVGDDMGKDSAWYDNEWGFASRMCDLAEYIHKI